ncbi:uncharacterized protein LOC141911310 [Tubulanus polymorphus]|uniref:uncharacterized protein LOC141911310 n=1 Tax=Tubulanus polymorphus TaxID=672921 RepID=UPI003DA65A9F
MRCHFIRWALVLASILAVGNCSPVVRDSSQDELTPAEMVELFEMGKSDPAIQGYVWSAVRNALKVGVSRFGSTAIGAAGALAGKDAYEFAKNKLTESLESYLKKLQ